MDQSFINESELAKLAMVIGEVEKKTSGEIRLMIVKRSSVTGHVHTVLWAMMVSATFLGLWFWRHDVVLWEQWWMWPAILGGLYVVSAVLARLEWVQRRFTPHHDLHHQVWARAEVEFHREGLSQTHLHTGVLLFVSLMERQALVLADKGIADKVAPHTWDLVVRTMVEGARTGRWAEKLEQSIRQCGEYLADHFPPEAVKTNELPNEVIFKD